MLGIEEDEWVLLVKTLGRIKDFQHLEFFYTSASRDFHPFQAIADAVNNAHSLLHLRAITNFRSSTSFSGLIALANAL
jgi:hypothetical protein